MFVTLSFISISVLIVPIIGASELQSLLGDGRECTIKNRHFPEYLYPADGFDADSERRRVFTWIPGDYDNQCLWNLERYESYSATTIRYKIMSTKFNEYLYAAADNWKYDAQRRQVFTWKPKTRCNAQCYWDIQLVKQAPGETQRYFTITNMQYGELFYAVDGALFDADRRRAFTWKFDPNHDVQNDLQTHWIIEC